MAWTEPHTFTTGELVTSVVMNEIRDQLNAMWPVGAYMPRAANYTTVETAVEDRWLQCNGAEVSRSTYAELFAWFNSLTPALPFGSAGAGTFTLPDLRGRVLVAEGEHTDVDAMGDSDGAAIGLRKPKHLHFSQYGSSSLGGTVPVIGQFDTSITSTYPTTPATSWADRVNHIQDTPAFLVFGSWFIKYRS